MDFIQIHPKLTTYNLYFQRNHVASSISFLSEQAQDGTEKQNKIKIYQSKIIKNPHACY
uniref:Uncharacterized protein n=1 Tax=Rhizophora mucronata TaxID=61149 RepID=A0A2P2P813_RHIMU